MKNGVLFGEKHSLDDWGLIFSTKTISAAEPQVTRINVPGRNGAIDYSEVLTNNIKYNDRTLSITFYTKRNVSEYPIIMAEIQNYLQGQKMHIVFDDDCAFYWLGRPQLDSMQCDKSLGKIVITAVVDPYKYTIQSTDEDWLWDPFDFEQGVINEFADLTVNGTLSIDVLQVGRYVNPIITVDNPMTVTFEGNTYNLVEGSNLMYEIVLSDTSKTMTFNGNGKVSVNVTGGSL